YARLGTLPPMTRKALAAAAALADPMIDMLGEEALRPAIEAGLVAVEGERLRFDHPLVASAAYAHLTAASRRALHRRLASLVRSPEERARHLALAADGPDSAVAGLLDDAAKHARARGAADAAAELGALALRLTEPSDGHADALRSVAAAEYRA